MATYSYRAASAAGPIKSGTIEADSPADAVARLQRQGLRPIATAEVRDKAAGASGSTVGAGARRGIKTGPVAKALGELAVLTGAGLPLDRSLTIVVDNSETPPLKALLADLLAQVREGRPLSEAIAGAGAAFPAMTAPMVEAGEASGRLDTALAKLAETLERGEKLRQTFVSAMIYPIILTLLATGVIVLMLLFVVPQFEGLFDSAANDLPATTQLVLAASRGLRSHGLLLIGLLVGAGFLMRAWLRQPTVRRALDWQLISLPRLGDLIRRIETARFARVLGSLLTGGVPLPAALALAQRSIGNRFMAAAVDRVQARVKEGGLVSQEFAATRLFPRIAISFMRTGEETARLDAMLGRLADVLDDEIAVRMARLTGLLTPVITIVMGVIIAVVIGSIMTAILGFNDLALE